MRDFCMGNSLLKTGKPLSNEEFIAMSDLLFRVPTNTNVFKGLPHGFRRFGDKLSACKNWDLVIEDGIRWAWSKPSASGKFIINEY